MNVIPFHAATTEKHSCFYPQTSCKLLFRDTRSRGTSRTAHLQSQAAQVGPAVTEFSGLSPRAFIKGSQKPKLPSILLRLAPIVGPKKTPLDLSRVPTEFNQAVSVCCCFPAGMIWTSQQDRTGETYLRRGCGVCLLTDPAPHCAVTPPTTHLVSGLNTHTHWASGRSGSRKNANPESCGTSSSWDGTVAGDMKYLRLSVAEREPSPSWPQRHR